MFKYISIRLTSPICNCPEETLSWGIDKGPKSRARMILTCKTCKTQLLVPNGKFVARFEFDQPYPGPDEDEDEEILTVLDGGKVLEFPKNEEAPDGASEDVP